MYSFLTIIMSRIGKKPVAIPNGIEVTLTGRKVTVKGPKGELFYEHLPVVVVKVEPTEVIVTLKDDEDSASSKFHGLTRQLIANMIEGVSKGFEKRLEIIGVGYKAAPSPKLLVLNLGHSHPINFEVPEGITIVAEEKNKNMLIISGIDKQKVGQTAAVIRSYRPPEPYKGKGVRYSDEKVRRKAGKTASKG